MDKPRCPEAVKSIHPTGKERSIFQGHGYANFIRAVRPDLLVILPRLAPARPTKRKFVVPFNKAQFSLLHCFSLLRAEMTRSWSSFEN